MRVQLLSLACDSGHPCSSFVQVGLSSDHQLLFHWWCEECNEAVCAYKGLADCWRDCPPKEQVEIAGNPTAITIASAESDSAFLSAVGICVPADVE